MAKSFEAVVEDGLPVQLPSGATFYVLTQDEVEYIRDRVTRYLADNHFCVAAGTRVLLQRGPVPVENVVVGDAAWSWDGKGFSLRRVVWAGLTASQPVVHIKALNRTIRCSSNHPILVREKHIPRRVGNRGRPVPEYRLEWKVAGDIRRGDLLVQQVGLPDVGGVTAGGRYATEGFAEFCGLFTGDGLLSEGRYVRITRGIAPSYMDHYRRIMLEEFTKVDGSPIHFYEAEGYTEFGSRLACDEIEQLGLTGGSHGKRVPSWVYGLQPKLRAAYLRGYIDADGSVWKSGRIGFGSPNHDLIVDVWHLAVGLGLVVSNVKRRAAVSTFVSSDAALNASIVGTNDLGDKARLNKVRPNRKAAYNDRYGRNVELPEHIALIKVRTVELEPPEPLYDVTVEGTHTFVADGVVVHNTNVSDLQDVDRMVIMECLVHRWSLWLSREKDYFGDAIDAKALRSTVNDYSTEVRQIKRGLGIDRVARDKQKGDDSVNEYLAQLRIRAQEFGVMREQQLNKALELFNQLKMLVTLHDNADEIERREMRCSSDDVFEWLRTVAFPEFDEIDGYFRENKQRFWVKKQ